MTIKRWELRINDLDASKGVSNKMIQSCMKAEIEDLRQALIDQAEAHARAFKAQEKKCMTQIEKHKRLVQEARERATKWRKYANKYQTLAAKKEKT